MRLSDRVQEWAADHGWAQYPIPRRHEPAFKWKHKMDPGTRVTLGLLGLFGVILFGGLCVAVALLIGVFGYAALTS